MATENRSSAGCIVSHPSSKMAPSSLATLALLCCVLATVSAFATHPRTRRASTESAPPSPGHGDLVGLAGRRTRRASVRDTDGDDFDPFAISPLSVGEDGDGGGGEASAEGSVSVIDALESLILPPEPAPAEAMAEAAPSSAGTAADLDFDPLLSPHAYADGVDAGPTTAVPEEEERVGILLIDHGSRRPASNEHIHNVAALYESNLRASAAASGGGAPEAKVVRAAHMEIAEPSILDSLRDIVADRGVTRVVCVPYFLSPGRHSTEDVPELISEARRVLRDEGVEAEVVVSGALGTVMPQMLGAIDALVDDALIN